MPSVHDLVLLDLDGTISDPLVGIGRSINYALSHFGFEEKPLYQLARHIGPPLDEAFRIITGSESPLLVRDLIAKFRERYAEVGYAENTLYSGIPEALRSLREADVPLGLCTSKRRDFAEKILLMFDIRSLFTFVDGGDVGVQKWQQIEALMTAGLASRSSVMVGDRSVDLVAAHRNGLCSAGVLWGHGSHAELEAENPRYLLQSPSELPSIVSAGT